MTAASQRLGFAQSTVTEHLQALEASVGIRLFERQGRSLAVTPTGSDAYRRACVVLRGVDDLRDSLADVRDGIAGEVRLGAIESAASSMVPGPLATFLKERPGVRVSLEVGGTTSLAGRLAAGDLDLVISAMPPSSDALVFEQLAVDRLVLLVHRSSPLSARTSVRMRELASERILLTAATCSYNAVLRDAASRAGVTLDVALESANVPTIVRAVQMQMGAAVFPLAQLESVPAKTTVVRIEDGRLRVAVGLTRSRRPESTTTRALASALTAGLRAMKR